MVISPDYQSRYIHAGVCMKNSVFNTLVCKNASFGASWFILVLESQTHPLSILLGISSQQDLMQSRMQL